MPKVAYIDAALTVWQGKDALQFIDGLSTNKTSGMVKGDIRQTVFTSSITEGSRSTNTALGTCFPVPVSLKKVV